MDESTQPQSIVTPKTKTKSRLAIVVLSLLLFVAVLTIGWLGYWLYLTPQEDNETTNNPSTTQTSSTPDTSLSADDTLAKLKAKMDSAIYKDATEVTASATTYYLSNSDYLPAPDYTVATTDFGYAVEYQDTSDLVGADASKAEIQKIFPSMKSVYTDLQKVLIDNGFTLDKDNTYISDKGGVSGGQQVVATNNQTVCAVTPIAWTDVDATNVYSIDFACSEKTKVIENFNLQKQLVDAEVAKMKSEEPATLIANPIKQNGDFIAASVTDRFADVGANQVIFKKTENKWSYLTATGQSLPECTDVDGSGVPASLVNECLSGDTVRAPKS